MQRTEFTRESMKEVGRRIATLREEKNLTQSALAHKIGVSRGLLSGWESGCRLPDVNSWYRLAMTFEVSTDYIAGTTSQRISKGASISDALDLNRLSDEGRDMLFEFYHMLLKREIFCAEKKNRG